MAGTHDRVIKLREFMRGLEEAEQETRDLSRWKRLRPQYIRELQAAYTDNDLVLFIGAGVSFSAGMPDWRSFLSRLMVSVIGERFPEGLSVSADEKLLIADRLRQLHGQSPLLEARYIRAGLGDTFAREVSKILYEGIDQPGQGTSDLLRAIARICLPRRSGPGVKAVVNYNFDDLVEKHLEDVGVRHLPVFRDADVANQEELGVYHVHGFLPRDTPIDASGQQNLLVFSEERYHALLLDPYAWSNIVQLNFLRENTCVLVGLSVTDPNLRRLLDIAAGRNNIGRHFVVLKRVLPDEFARGQAPGQELAPDVLEAFLDGHHRLQEDSFKEIGLKILWIESFDELPALLESIRG